MATKPVAKSAKLTAHDKAGLKLYGAFLALMLLIWVAYLVISHRRFEKRHPPTGGKA